MYLELILPSLREQTFRDFDITVVDNGSTDGSVEYLKEHWPDVRIVELGENTGFPAAVNAGIAASGGEYIALLNNDIELSADWIEGLVAELDRDPELGFVTGKILRFAEWDVVEQAGHDFYTCGLFAPRGIGRKGHGTVRRTRGDRDRQRRRRHVPARGGGARRGVRPGLLPLLRGRRSLPEDAARRESGPLRPGPRGVPRQGWNDR